MKSFMEKALIDIQTDEGQKFLKEFLINEQKIENFVEQNTELLIEQILDYKNKFNICSIDTEDLNKHENLNVEKEHISCLFSYLLFIAKKQDYLMYLPGRFLTEIAYFSFKDKHFSLERVTGQGTYTVLSEDNNNISPSKIIIIENINNYSPVSFNIKIIGKDKNKNVKKYKLNDVSNILITKYELELVEKTMIADNSLKYRENVNVLLSDINALIRDGFLKKNNLDSLSVTVFKIINKNKHINEKQYVFTNKNKKNYKLVVPFVGA